MAVGVKGCRDAVFGWVGEERMERQKDCLVVEESVDAQLKAEERMEGQKDYLVRATAGDGQVRAFAATTRDTVEEARRRHETSPVATAALGRLLTAGAIMGSMMKGDKDLLTLQITADGPLAGITVTADAKGNVKGYVGNPTVLIPANAKGKLDVAGAVGKGVLSVRKDLGLKEPYAGETLLQTGEIAEDLTYYFATSEQVPSAVGLGVLMNKENTVARAGGFLVQLLPFATEEVTARLEENLKAVTSVTAMLDAGMMPEGILEKLLCGLSPQVADAMPVRFFCNCSRERVEKVLLSVGKAELLSMEKEGKPVEVACHFCNSKYVFSPEEVGDMARSLSS